MTRSCTILHVDSNTQTGCPERTIGTKARSRLDETPCGYGAHLDNTAETVSAYNAPAIVERVDNYTKQRGKWWRE